MIGDILQPTHLLFVLVIALLVLGPKRLPEVGKSLGRGLRDFRSALNGDEIRSALTGEESHDDDVVASVAATPQPQPVDTSTHQPTAAEAHQPAPAPVEHTS